MGEGMRGSQSWKQMRFQLQPKSSSHDKSSSIRTKVCFHTQFNHLLSWVARCLGPWEPITTTSCNWLGCQATRHQTPLVVVVDAFFLAREDSGRMFDSSFPACAFFKGLACTYSFHSSGQDQSVHSGSVNWENCDWVFPDELRMSLFLDRFPYNAWTAT